VIPVKFVLNFFTTNRDADLCLKYYLNDTPYTDELNTNGFPGLDHHIPVQFVAHTDEKLSCKVINKNTTTAKDISYYFYGELLPEDNIYVRQIVFARSPTLAPYETDYVLGEFHVTTDKFIVVYELGFTRVANIHVFFEKDDVIVPPTEGLRCETTRDITRGMPVKYLLVHAAGERKLRVLATNMSGSSITFPYRILAQEVTEETAKKFGVYIPPPKEEK